VLAHKNIPHETINVDLKEKPEWFLERNPLGLVPTLEQDDKIVYESLITCEYLDDTYPQQRLLPTDPFTKAQDAMLVDFYGSKCTANMYKVMRSEGKDEEGKEGLVKGLTRLEAELGKRGTFFGGDKVAMIDFSIWPWFERLPLLSKTAPDTVPSASNFPKLFAWTQAMLEEPAVKATCFDLDTHLKFLLSSKAGKPNYDLGLDP